MASVPLNQQNPSLISPWDPLCLWTLPSGTERNVWVFPGGWDCHGIAMMEFPAWQEVGAGGVGLCSQGTRDKRKRPQTAPREVQVGFWGKFPQGKGAQAPAWAAWGDAIPGIVPKNGSSARRRFGDGLGSAGFRAALGDLRGLFQPPRGFQDFVGSSCSPSSLPQRHPEQVTAGTEPPAHTRSVPGAKSLCPCGLSGPALPGAPWNIRRPREKSWMRAGGGTLREVEAPQ